MAPLGIISYQLYLPHSSALEYDEDSVTFAWQALEPLFADVGNVFDVADVAALYVGTQSPPFHAKSIASFLASVFNVTSPCLLADFTSDSSAAVKAFLHAVNALNTSPAKLSVAVACDFFADKNDQEKKRGAAAAFLLGSAEKYPVKAVIRSSLSYPLYLNDSWQHPYEPSSQQMNRYAQLEGLEKNVTERVKNFMQLYGLTSHDCAYFVMATPYPKSSRRIGLQLGFSARQCEVDELCVHQGSVDTMVALAQTLKKARNGEKLLVVSYGSSVDILLLEVGKN